MRIRGRLAGAVVITGLLGSGLMGCGGDDDGGAVASGGLTITTAAPEEKHFEPEVEGEFTVPPYGDINEQPSGDDRERQELVKSLGAADEPEPGGAKPATGPPTGARALTLAEACRRCAGFTGLKKIYQYDNDSPGVDKARSCGQAAAATVLRHWGKISGDDAVTQVWNRYEPNVFNDGTNWDREQEAIQGFGLNAYWATGLDEMKEYIKLGYPAILMVDVGAVGDRWGGHWVVAYAYDDDGIYITNWDFGSEYVGYLTHAELNRAWGLDPDPNTGWIVKASGAAGVAMIAFP